MSRRRFPSRRLLVQASFQLLNSVFQLIDNRQEGSAIQHFVPDHRRGWRAAEENREPNSFHAPAVSLSVDAICSGEHEKLQALQVVENVVRDVLDWVSAEVDCSDKRSSAENVAIDRLDVIVGQIELYQLREHAQIRHLDGFNVPIVVSDGFKVREESFNVRRHEVIVAVGDNQ